MDNELHVFFRGDVWLFYKSVNNIVHQEAAGNLGAESDDVGIELASGI